MRKETLTEKEKATIRKKYPRKHSKLRYGIWKNEQRNGLQIVILNQFQIQQGRKPGMDNAIEFIAEVPLSEKEYEEGVANWGMIPRAYLMYKYKTIEQVIREDLKCGYKTPDVFIKECKKRGLTEAPNLFTNTESL